MTKAVEVTCAFDCKSSEQGSPEKLGMIQP